MDAKPSDDLEALVARVDRLRELAEALIEDEPRAERRKLLAQACSELRGQCEQVCNSAERMQSQLDRVSHLLDCGPDAYFVTDDSGMIAHTNPAAANLLKVPLRYLIGKPLSLFIDDRDLRAFRWRVNNARSQAGKELAVRVRPRDGHTFVGGFTGAAFESQGNQPAELRWFLRDISVRERAQDLAAAHEFTKEVLESEQRARTVAELAQRRLEALAHVSRAFTGSADWTLAFADAGDIIVPALADLFVADLLVGEALERVILAHADGAMAERLRRDSRPPADLSGGHPIAQALRNGMPERPTEVTQEWLAVWAEPAETLSVWQDAGLSSVIIMPIQSPRQTHGVLTFGWAYGRQYDPADLGLLIEIVLRMALALDTSRLIRDLESEQRHRDEFLAMLAHELRNPLAAITTGLDALERANSSDRARVTGIIARQSRHLARLLNDLLQVSRIRFGQVTLQHQIVDLGELARNSLEAMQAGAQGERATMTFRAGLGPVRVLGDPDRLEEVIDNLLDNALKYTPSGGTIELSVAAEGDQAVVRVRDSGIGISADFLPRVFDVFSRSSTQRPPTSRPGLGLGLSVVRDLIANHGGSVRVSSEGVGRGSEFVVRLPLVSGESTSRRAEPLRPAAPVSVLVVEDNEDAREALRIALELSGQHVRTADNGAHAIEEIREHPPDTAVIDVGLPDMDGYQVARAVRAEAGGDRVHLIALTGYGQPTDRERALSAGFDSWLVKPIDPSVLLGVIAKGRDTAPASVASPPPPS